MIRRLAVVLPAILLTAVLLAGCGTSRPVDAMPAYSTGHGTDGSVSVLQIHQDGSDFTGTYVNTPSGWHGVSLLYVIQGTVTSGDRFTSTWDFGGVLITATGAYTGRSITLDNPSGLFSTTVFRASP